MSKLPLYTVIPKERFEALVPSAGYRKGGKNVILDTTQHTVGLKIGDVYYAQQFGHLAQALGKFNEIKRKLRDGENL